MWLIINRKNQENNLFLLGGGGRGQDSVCVRIHGRDRADVHGRDRSDAHEETGQGKKETVGPGEEVKNDNDTSYVLTYLKLTHPKQTPGLPGR